MGAIDDIFNEGSTALVGSSGLDSLEGAAVDNALKVTQMDLGQATSGRAFLQLQEVSSDTLGNVSGINSTDASSYIVPLISWLSSNAGPLKQNRTNINNINEKLAIKINTRTFNLNNKINDNSLIGVSMNIGLDVCKNISYYESILYLYVIVFLTYCRIYANSKGKEFNINKEFLKFLLGIYENEAMKVYDIYENQFNKCVSSLNEKNGNGKDVYESLEELLKTYYNLTYNSSEQEKLTNELKKIDSKLKDKINIDKRKAYYENIEYKKTVTYLKYFKYVFWAFFIVYSLFIIIILKNENKYIRGILIIKVLIIGIFMNENIYYSKLLYDFMISLLPVDVFRTL